MSSVEDLRTSEASEIVPCPSCGSDFERVVTTIGNAVLKPRLCRDCEARQEIEVAPQPKPAEDVRDWLLGLGVNTRKHGHATIENFDPVDAPRAPSAARDFVRATLEAGRHDRVRSLYLVSESKGSGKTHLAVAIMRAVHEARPDLRVVFDPVDRLIARIQDSYGTGTTDQLVELRRDAGLYILDDLGREKDTPDALRTICTVLDEREGAPTVITSNRLPSELGARARDADLWARVASRLGDGVYRYVAVDGRDRRFAA